MASDDDNSFFWILKIDGQRWYKFMARDCQMYIKGR